MNSEAELADALQGLPHADPFRFLGKIVQFDEDTAEGSWSVHGDEDFFRGHFPGRPLVPGVLITEAAAQLAGVVTRRRTTVPTAVLVISESRFRKTIEPPARIDLQVRIERVMGSIHVFDFTAMVGKDVCADGQVGLSVDMPS
ncbi:MAG: hypothetical protein MK085_06765 [Phycisphaerales bacterium]|nr:hypothetical protein [Phycisphaerales bacterium]